ncbi:MAG: peptidase C45 [Saprospiraceae bacterium]|uniref:Peptidase C45 n=1 Tax=Candidatus Defluviibacterium haderslevense TaxID=2981993 RepID=A0A9D7S662_9BACT|nr:peptidase C45 [Candidatus Defluviibacterium haderslevense]MBK9716403.1 peptidase C45 [Candidatus Defluviibacterium haderslevense]MBL0238748.1 peptidase C45 [Candidatus Defluviibacterium haderslevense]
MKLLRKIRRILVYFLLGIIVLLLSIFVYLYFITKINFPKVDPQLISQLHRTNIDSTSFQLGNNWLRKSNTGLWEMYTEGKPYERGLINGILSKELIYSQEMAFHNQICKIVPSAFYRHFLKYFIGWFNRDLINCLTLEQKEEIYGISQSASSEFNYIGNPYQRLLNYHAAHDIGHALQNLALVGCSSFATWGTASLNNDLIIGRNFDFFVGEDFAKNKIIAFCNPDSGYKFMTITWGGMTGVLSGMNIKGITVTINAAKSTIPEGSATPISLLSREILQYASNINEAISIAKSRKTFVSESIMIGSAPDSTTIIIEKTPDKMDVVYPHTNKIICTNHYQSSLLNNESSNIDQKQNSASLYRSDRINELLAKVEKNTVTQTAQILRNQLGLNEKNIGLGNEKAINQLICHHSIIFKPYEKLVWISTAPWQLGSYISYDLNKIFDSTFTFKNHEIYVSNLTIEPDTFLNSKTYLDFKYFQKCKEHILANVAVDSSQFINSNPEFYQTYLLLGDAFFKKKNYQKAEWYYKLSLTKEVATKNEYLYIQEQLTKCNNKD